MGDEDDGHAGLALQIAQKIQNLRLDGHVQGGGRLIGDQQGRFAGDGHGDHRPLQHPAGKLERMLARPLGRFGNARHLQQLNGPRQGLTAGLAAMGHQGFGDLVADGHGRVERGHRVLEYHAHGVAADVPAVDFGAAEDFRAAQPGTARSDAARRHGNQSHHALHHHRLAAARFAHHGEGAARLHSEAHPAHRLDDAAVGVELHR